MDLEAIRKFLGLDSLRYITLEGLQKSLMPPAEQYCFACFTGEYPVSPEKDIGKFVLEATRVVPGC
jgi:amidophosphoribosyltransferase